MNPGIKKVLNLKKQKVMLAKSKFAIQKQIDVVEKKIVLLEKKSIQYKNTIDHLKNSLLFAGTRSIFVKIKANKNLEDLHRLYKKKDKLEEKMLRVEAKEFKINVKISKAIK